MHLPSRLIALGAALLLAVGSIPTVGAAPAAQTAADAKTLVIGAAFDIKTLDPARGFEQIGGMVHKSTYDTLVTLSETDISQIVPNLAQSWDVSPDARVFTFHLRPGVKFQNSGNTMTSADVKWSLERAIAIKGNPSFLLDGIVKVDAPDPMTVVITKSDSDPAFIAKGSYACSACWTAKRSRPTVVPTRQTRRKPIQRRHGSIRTPPAPDHSS
jgi:peptide/nickel transport system substrate-binding protein